MFSRKTPQPCSTKRPSPLSDSQPRHTKCLLKFKVKYVASRRTPTRPASPTPRPQPLWCCTGSSTSAMRLGRPLAVTDYDVRQLVGRDDGKPGCPPATRCLFSTFCQFLHSPDVGALTASSPSPALSLSTCVLRNQVLRPPSQSWERRPLLSFSFRTWATKKEAT